MEQAQNQPYPLTFNVDYPDRPLNRLTTFFRFLWIIPILVIATLLTSGTISIEGTDYSWSWTTVGILFAAPGAHDPVPQEVPALVVRLEPPAHALPGPRLGLRALLRDEYPSTDEEQAVHLDFAYPDARQLSRGLPLVKWFLAIPHWIVLFFLWIGAVVCIVIAWFAILFTGRYPRSLFDYVVGVSALVATGGGVRVAAGHRPVPAVHAAAMNAQTAAGRTGKKRPEVGRSCRHGRKPRSCHRLCDRGRLCGIRSK